MVKMIKWQPGASIHYGTTQEEETGNQRQIDLIARNQKIETVALRSYNKKLDSIEHW